MNPEPTVSRKDQVLALLRAGLAAEARAAAEALCAREPRHPEHWYLRGCACGTQKQYSEAETCFRRALTLDPGYVVAAFHLAQTLSAQGRTDEAIEGHRAVLSSQPDHAEAHYALGACLYRAGRLDEAETSLSQAVRGKPDFPDAWYTLGNLRHDRGDFPGAETAYREVIGRDPGHVEAHLNLGAALADLGNLEEAMAMYRATLALRPEHAEAHNNLGLALYRHGEHARAVEHYRAALAVMPDYPEAQLNLALARRALGQLQEAESCLVNVLGTHPDYVEAHIHLGLIKAGQGRWDEALACCREARRLGPNSFENWQTLGTIYAEAGRRREAIDCYREALRIDTHAPGLWNNLAVLHAARFEISQGLECAREALRCDPDYTPAHHVLADLHRHRGELDEAIVCHHEVSRLDPDNPALSSGLLSCLNYHPAWTPRTIFEEHRRWGEKHGRTRAGLPPAPNSREPERRLKVGYVSADFWQHSVAFFIEPVLAQHDRTRFEIYCYAQVAAPDAVTERLKQLAAHWRPIVGLGDREVADRIRADEIDILVDLGGHTAHNRLLAFAYRPAPVQASYIGYPNTTGLPAMDYRIVNPWTVPPGSEVYFTETVVRLPYPHCFCPPADCPPVNAPPALDSGRVTFGSFNNLAKLAPPVIALWAAILQAVPGSRLMLKSQPFIDADTRDLYRARFAAHGIGPERLLLCGSGPLHEFLRCFNDIDIALDPFPYNGGTTSYHALWMGIPVVTLVGQTYVSRMGYALLAGLGLEELVAKTPTEYVAIAAGLAADPGRLQALRASLRERMAVSPLTDGERYTAALEKLYRDIWRDWCAHRPRTVGKPI